MASIEWFHREKIYSNEPQCYVVTAHGLRAYLSPGDYVIAEPEGTGHYPCKESIFVSLYDPA